MCTPMHNHMIYLILYKLEDKLSQQYTIVGYQLFKPMTFPSMHAIIMTLKKLLFPLLPLSSDTLVTTCVYVPAVSQSGTLVTVHRAWAGRDTEDHNVLTGRMLTSASGSAKSALNYHSSQKRTEQVYCSSILCVHSML